MCIKSIRESIDISAPCVVIDGVVEALSTSSSLLSLVGMTSRHSRDLILRLAGQQPSTLATRPPWQGFNKKGYMDEALMLEWIRVVWNCRPGGMMSTLQPLVVVLNKPFKDRVRLEYQEWMSGDNLKTPMGSLQRPPLATACGWVLSAWRSLLDSMVENAFKKCCISNLLDGSQ
ncbi:hypothetical protein HPB51_011404 [Rhipicephalus microplus]|uniref:Uncharacterized protein n=1 Tax=Rhipicephalus microplus TaxID=6941 RepID=A0A9J6F384_RHIMP|nr:hypothetical protein HPB51_011404 [Rhipicephalus microplus]